jgi:succinyl-CoA synthetase beta subunit
MHIHEYQAKLLLREYGIDVPHFRIISNPMETDIILSKLGITAAVVKVQVHAGGRGKAGGIKLSKSPEEIFKAVEQLLGMKIVNNQTGKEGIIARQVMISELVNYTKEYYLAATIDRHNAQAVLILSPEGGMEIEEIAANTPERIMKLPFDKYNLPRNYKLIEMVKFMGWTGAAAEQGKKIIHALAKAFIELDAVLIEINPLVLTENNRLIALDAKMTIDDNALFRHEQIAELYDPTQVPSLEARAKESDLAYVTLNGNIGCMVNGAGLAMATMDIIKHYGGSPANFLDVGGGASQEKVAEGFKIILSDPKVDAILVNIFGGIMNCVTLAAGIITATTESKMHLPLVIRMEGTNVEKGSQILADSGLDIILAKDLGDAAKKVVEAAHSRRDVNNSDKKKTS